MGFQVSPGVNVSEIDLTTIVPAVATTSAGFAGCFRWGPVGERVLVDSPNRLREIFGPPDDNTSNFFFTAYNFLGYGNNLSIVRAFGNSAGNANSLNTQGVLIKNRSHFDGGASASLSTAEFIAKYPGELGNSIAVVVFDDNGRTGGAGLGLTAALNIGDSSVSGGFSGGGNIARTFLEGDRIIFANGDVHTVTNTVPGVSMSGVGGNDASTVINFTPALREAKASGATFEIESRFAQFFPAAPSTTDAVAAAGGTNDELNIAVIDHDGKWTGTKFEVLELYPGVSKATDAVDFQGNKLFYKEQINDRSNYIWARANLAGINSGDNDKTTTFTQTTSAFVNTFQGGFTTGITGGKPAGGGRIIAMSGSQDDNLTIYGATVGNGDLVLAYKEFEDPESVDCSLLLGGPAEATVQSILVDICDARKDCIAFLSPVQSATDPAGLVQDKTTEDAAKAVVNFRDNTLNKSSSFAVLDSGFKVMLDPYNDVLRHVPLNGDIAGLCARTEQEQEAWFSPAGFNRGQIRGVVKLDFNPRQTQRDELYKNGINPVVSFPGEGTVLFGDKTLQSKPSAFDRINVRRLFIVLEKAIATAAKFLLFEFNDEFTRAQFRNLVVPFLRTVQSRRGLTDFKVVCDETNNPGDVVDRNEFVGDIFIKPNRSINFIQLNFIATPTGVDFTEVGG